MSRIPLPRWIVQAAFGIALVTGLSFVLGAAPSPAPQAQATGVSAKGGCEPGYSARHAKCEDVNGARSATADAIA
jgi:hypothetical protein